MIIFDLDGTLADISHRRHLVDKKVRSKSPDWDQFFRACVEDKPIEPTIYLFHAMRSANAVIQIWSGRSELVRKETEAWLEKFVYRGSIKKRVPLRMRPEGDFTPDAELKECWLNEVLSIGGHVDFVVDDRKRVVEMWRRRGVFCLQCAEGDY